ncbi:MAG: DUF503 domain-containing protein [Chloroflexi bacterium]|nr:DUF503 domain-containing protein [Chloroflexota bacterium]
MVVGICTIKLHIPGNHSLKDKRQVLKSLLARVRKEFNVSIAEVEGNDLWQMAVIGVACVSNDASHAHATLTKVVEFIERVRPDVQVVDFTTEIM